MMTEAETGVRQLQAQDSQSPPVRGKEEVYLVLHREHGLVLDTRLTVSRSGREQISVV